MKSKMIIAALALLVACSSEASAQGHRGNGRGRGHDKHYRDNRGGYYDNRCYDRPYARGRRVVYRPAPAAYCQPVVVAPAPRYCPPPPRYVYGRPRVNINIGF